MDRKKSNGEKKSVETQVSSTVTCTGVLGGGSGDNSKESETERGERETIDA